ncbi:hypothetical protein GEMRC1_011420 [Eukaryota sp. GEM-RC1]
MNNTNVVDLTIFMDALSTVEVVALAEMFCSNTTLKKLSLGSKSSTKDEDYMILFSAISNNLIIDHVDISGLKIAHSNVVLPILNSSTIQSLSFPSGCTIDCTLMNALKNNSAIREVTFRECTVRANDFVDVLNLNNVLKKLKIPFSNFCSFSPIFKVLETNNSLIELDLSYRKEPLIDQEVEALVKMLRKNNKLLALNLNSITLSSTQFTTILRELESSSLLRSVSFAHSLRLNSLISYFKAMFSAQLISLIGISPHCIDVSLGLIRYQFKVGYRDLMSLLNALQSNIPIKRVECRGLKSLSLERLIVIFQILSVDKSVIDLDISPHLIDVENGMFCFFPEQSTEITTEEVSFLKTLLKCYNIKRLTLQRCRFSFKAIQVLCDLIKINNTLTSVDFSCFELYNSISFYYSEGAVHISKVINSFQSHSHLRTINLSHVTFGFNHLLTIYELISTGHLPPNIKVFPHSIDVSLGLIRYLNQIKHDHLISLLKALKSNVHIKRVECCELYPLNFAKFIALFKILALNKSVLDLDVSPHLIDVENCVFVFLHKSLLKLLQKKFHLYSVFCRVILSKAYSKSMSFYRGINYCFV